MRMELSHEHPEHEEQKYEAFILLYYYYIRYYNLLYTDNLLEFPFQCLIGPRVAMLDIIPTVPWCFVCEILRS